jgi:hypothetical protein
MDPPERSGGAKEVIDLIRALGIEIRAGIHTGECERIDNKAGG